MSYENSYNINEFKPTEIIEDYLELIRCSYPYCNCGKCITKRYSHHPPNYQYEKNLKSSYKNEFNWKKSDDKKIGIDGKKPIIQNIGLDNCFKEHLKTSLISVMKNDYSKNFKLKEDLVLNNFKNQKEKVTKNNDNTNLTIKINNNNTSNFNYNNIGNEKETVKSRSQAKINTSNTINQQSNGYMKLTKTNNFNTLDNSKNYNINKENIENQHRINVNSKNNNFGLNINDIKENKTINDKNSSCNNNNKLTKLDIKSEIINNNDNNDKTLIPPFIGRSSYERMYPDWHTVKVIKEKVKSTVYESVPFNARSSYQDNFYQHEKRYYVDRAAPILKSDNLESSGKLINESTTKQAYKPIDYKNYNKLNNKSVNVSKRPSSIVPAPYSKDSFLSSYERAFMYNNLRNKSNQRNVNRSVIY